MKPPHKHFFTSLKQVEKRLKLEQPPNEPPSQSQSSISSSPLYLQNHQTNTNTNTSSISQAPQEFLSNNPFQTPPNQIIKNPEYPFQSFENNDDIDIGSMKKLLGLREFDGKGLEMNVFLGGATHVDIACDPELVKLVTSLTRLPVCVSSVDPSAFLAAVEAGASMVEIGNYDSFYDAGITFSPEQILSLTVETRRLLPLVTLSVTVPHTLSLPDQAKLAELLEQEGVDIIQTEGGKCSNPSKSGVLGLIEKASPTLAAAYSISRAVKIPVMCASGLSAVTAPMAITAGAAGVGVGSAINKLNDVVAMIAEVRSIADSLGLSTKTESELEKRAFRL